jgi:hypothetical protein
MILFPELYRHAVGPEREFGPLYSDHVHDHAVLILYRGTRAAAPTGSAGSTAFIIAVKILQVF